MHVAGMHIELFINGINPYFLPVFFLCIQLIAGGIQQFQSKDTEPGFELNGLMTTFSFFTLIAEYNFPVL